jgi:acyl-CoA reductase-like NAD-dependent aldehyde dehydrogenase
VPLATRPASRCVRPAPSPRDWPPRSASSPEIAQRFVDEAQAGVIHVNSTTTGAEVQVPFGGIKASGWGPPEQGPAAIEFYTEPVTIYRNA